MRKTFGLLCAAALVLPVGVITASAAGGAGATPTCTKASGTATYNPAIPKGLTAGGPKKSSKLTASGTVSGCAGGGVVKGNTSFVQTSKPTPGNCYTLLHPSGTSTGTLGTLTIKWNNGKTSTAKGFKIKQKAGAPTTALTTGKITAGAFVGKSISGSVDFKPKVGNCSTSDLKSVSYSQTPKTKFVIK